jgi:hypothetical protein
MKNKAGIIIGFVLGFTGFLLLFKLIFLDHILPEDEIAPGMVMIAAILAGIACAFAGRLLQKSFTKKRN